MKQGLTGNRCFVPSWPLVDRAYLREGGDCRPKLDLSLQRLDVAAR